MYLPASFAERNPDLLANLIRDYPFATLISFHEGRPFASHIPLLLDRSGFPDTGELRGRLIGHVSAANPQWKSARGSEVLVIFHGPHAYVSPSCYGAGDAVPTWNHLALHLYGTLRVVDDPTSVRRILVESVTRFESERETPWTIDKVSVEFIEQLLPGIVALEIEIDRVEGKLKLSQNQSDDRRSRVVDGLLASDSWQARDVALVMREYNLRNRSHPPD